MSAKEKGKVFPQNQLPIDKDKLKEEQKAELKAAIEAYDFPTLPPYDES
jgi:hypothetical protein